MDRVPLDDILGPRPSLRGRHEVLFSFDNIICQVSRGNSLSTGPLGAQEASPFAFGFPNSTEGAKDAAHRGSVSQSLRLGKRPQGRAPHQRTVQGRADPEEIAAWRQEIEDARWSLEREEAELYVVTEPQACRCAQDVGQ